MDSTPKAPKPANRAKTLILEALQTHGSLTSPQITEKTGLSQPDISVAGKELVDAGVVLRKIGTSAKPGRKPWEYTLAAPAQAAVPDAAAATA